MTFRQTCGKKSWNCQPLTRMGGDTRARKEKETSRQEEEITSLQTRPGWQTRSEKSGFPSWRFRFPPRALMACLIFDIETTALPLETFDAAQQEYLFRELEKVTDEAEREKKRADILRQFNLWPFTAQVACIAMLNAETNRGQVLFTADDYEEGADEAGPVEYVACADEVELLTAFWDVAKHYENISTFNGRGFDVPFLYLRSAALNVPITRKQWLGYRFATEPHCDLRAIHLLRRQWPRRRRAPLNLDFYCKAFASNPQGPGRDRHGRE